MVGLFLVLVVQEYGFCEVTFSYGHSFFVGMITNVFWDAFLLPKLVAELGWSSIVEVDPINRLGQAWWRKLIKMRLMMGAHGYKAKNRL